jgi:hypothetical protein
MDTLRYSKKIVTLQTVVLFTFFNLILDAPRTLKIAFFDLTNRIKIVIISKNLFGYHDFFNKMSSSQ